MPTLWRIISDLSSTVVRIAQDLHAQALDLPDTLDNFNKLETNLTILRPLIGHSEKEIEQKLEYYVH